jgi:hypothetical protein
MVPKKDGSWRPCGNYPRLSMITTPDKYPLPNMQDLSNGLDGCSAFSKVNLDKGYHQIPVAPEDIPKTAIITPFGLFEYLFTPFSVSSATQTFQRTIDRTYTDLEGTFPYMDDTRVGSPDRETHLHHLSKLFAALALNGLAINLEKCVFAVQTLEFLGHRTSTACSAPATNHTAEIQNCSSPRTSSNCNVFSHGEFLPPFLAKLCSSVAPFNRSPEGGTADSAVNRHSPGVFSNSQAPPGCRRTAAASFSNSRTFPRH